MTLITTNPKLVTLAVEMAAELTDWTTEVFPLDDGGWYVRNAHCELSEATIRQRFSLEQREQEQREARRRVLRARQEAAEVQRLQADQRAWAHTTRTNSDW